MRLVWLFNLVIKIRKNLKCRLIYYAAMVIVVCQSKSRACLAAKRAPVEMALGEHSAHRLGFDSAPGLQAIAERSACKFRFQTMNKPLISASRLWNLESKV